MRRGLPEGEGEERAALLGKFLARFPEVPRDLCDEAILTEYVRAFGSLLRLAQKPRLA